MPISLEDYKHFYEECFGKHGKDIVFVSQTFYYPGSKRIGVKGHKIVDNMWYPFTAPQEEITYPMPELGYVNVKSVAAFITRFPTRQWKRGYSYKTLEIRHIPKELMAIIYPLDRDIAEGGVNVPETVYGLYNRIFPVPGAAIKSILERDAISVALTPQIAIAMTNHPEQLAIYYGESLIGAFALPSRTIKIPAEASYFIPQIRQIFRTEEITSG